MDGKRSIFIYNFLDRIPEKSMGKQVERHGNANDHGRNILILGLEAAGLTKILL
jgi:hypothetical protein